MEPIDLAIGSWHSQLLLPPSERTSMRDIADQFGIPQSTLSRRVSGVSLPRSQAHIPHRALTTDEEDALVEYIRRMSLLGHPPPPHIVTEVALELLKNRVSMNPPPNRPTLPILGHNWVARFRKRHPELCSVWTRNLDTLRLHAESPEKLAPWFAEIGALTARHAYPPSLIFNMDETGFAIGAAAQSTRVLTVIDGPRVKKANQAAGARQESVTSIECISAAGTVLPPFIIYKGTGTMNDRWVPHNIDVSGWGWAVSNKGWTNDTLGYNWLIQVFGPQTRPLPPLDPSSCRLLIIDGHGSHMQGRFIAFCMQHAIDLAILPSHSSHKTQPLDVGVFGPLKRTLSRLSSDEARIHDGRITKADWASLLARAREKSITKAHIEDGWRGSCLYPFNPTKMVPGFDGTSQVRHSTPPPTRIPLQSVQNENRDFLTIHGADMKTPVKNRFNQLSSQLSTERTRSTMFGARLDALTARINQPKRARAGISVSNLGTHILSTEDIHAQVIAAEASRAAKKRKGKGRVTQPDSPGPDEHNPFIQIYRDDDLDV